MKFSIRDLLWLLTVVGLISVWAMTLHRRYIEVERHSRSVNEMEWKRKHEVDRLQREIDRLRKEAVLRKQVEQGSLAYPF